ncbi:hypothetical protein C8F01DRAFT_1363877 [Mycena amicta]|nr:hypothetical protein C8F01DRAFT_1363877 [Mycena amicta]
MLGRKGCKAALIRQLFIDLNVVHVRSHRRHWHRSASSQLPCHESVFCGRFLPPTMFSSVPASVLSRLRWLWALFRRRLGRLMSLLPRASIIIGGVPTAGSGSREDTSRSNRELCQWISPSNDPPNLGESFQPAVPAAIGPSSPTPPTAYSVRNERPQPVSWLSDHLATATVSGSASYQRQDPSTVTEVVPILPEQFGRYRIRDIIPREKTEPQLHCRIEPETFDLSTDRVDPVGWKAVLHPEGALYFHDLQRRVLTDADLYEPANLVNVNRVIALIAEAIRTSTANPMHYAALLGEGSGLPAAVDLVIDIDPFPKKPEKGYYYFIHHSARTPFWVHPFQAAELEIWEQISGPITRQHLKHAMESQYWQHCIMLPSVISLDEKDIGELKDLLAFSVADMTTSSKSTVSSSLDELRHWMAVAKTMQCDGLGSGTAFAKIMDCFAQTKFLNFYGLPCARLNQDQSVYERHSGRSYLFRLLSPLLFFAPVSYLDSLERSYVDGLVLTRIWKPFIRKLNTEWQDFTLIGTVLLAANVAFLSINSVDSLTTDGHHTAVQTLSYVSILASSGSIMLGFLLVRQNRTKFHDTAAGISAAIHRRTSKRFGLELLAMIFALPHSLAVWAMLAFFAAVLAACTSVNDAARVTTSAVAALVGLLVLWCIWDAWDMQAADQAPFGLVLRRRIAGKLRSVWTARRQFLPKISARLSEKQKVVAGSV